MKNNEKLEEYYIESEKIGAKVEIRSEENEISLMYNLIIPVIEKATAALLDDVRSELVKQVNLTVSEILDIRNAGELKKKFYKKIYEIVKKKMPNEPEKNLIILSGMLLNKSFGLGDIEFLINDSFLEEIVINGSNKPVWVFHKQHGWLKTNLKFKSENTIFNYAASIGRKIGRQINNLDPLLDAHLTTGDRINATLFPISSFGNTITIRKFRRNPWTAAELVQNKTISLKMMSILWLAVQYEMSIIFSGGTGSGKTTLMNAVMSLLPANQRIISIEDTREINMPEYLHWVPLTTREANNEGKGEITMLDLLVNSLRMRPDYIIVGEIRRGPEAEVLFEALHTGHTVYSTVHADTAEQTIKRLTNEPINIPSSMIESLPLIVVMYRHRKKRVRRVLEISEVYSTLTGAEEEVTVNTMYKWNARSDSFEQQNQSIRFIEELKMHTGMNEKEVEEDLKEKAQVLDYMIKKQIFDVNLLGEIVNEYYLRKDELLKKIRDNK
jgi:archaeal flagellar protein FlaI